ncbi:MAG: hypothetical protein ACXABY_07740 [Candidatus Thorarchaeota archaeon]|jgi:hypothetical protein
MRVSEFQRPVSSQQVLVEIGVDTLKRLMAQSVMDQLQIERYGEMPDDKSKLAVQAAKVSVVKNYVSILEVTKAIRFVETYFEGYLPKLIEWSVWKEFTETDWLSWYKELPWTKETF